MADTARVVDDMIVVRPGPEEAIKSGRTRRFWQHTLRDNIADALSRNGIEHELNVSFGRVFITAPRRDDAMAVLPRVFGISSFSPVAAVAPAELDAITAVGREACAAAVRDKRYAVRCRRQGGQPFQSPDVERELGAALNDLGTVHLDNPDVTVFVEAVGRRAVITCERRDGVGGMPAGIQGRAVALLSGGFDSVVAAWRIMRRGAHVDFVFCNLGGRASERLVLQIAAVLTHAWAHGLRPRFHVVDFSDVTADMKNTVKSSRWQVVLKRLMYRAACRVAADTGADAIVTGEAIGQVSSQTLANLSAIDPVADRPVLRPLCGFDKDEIMAEARRIGTAPLSERIREHCALSTGRPVVRCRPATLDKHEEALDSALLDRAVSERSVRDVMNVTADDLRQPFLFTEQIPAGSRVIDCQPAHMYRHWHAPGAEHWDADRLARRFRDLPRDRTYVLYCSFGTQTPVLAELMQQAGYEAYAFQGGLSRVQAYAEAQMTDAPAAE